MKKSECKELVSFKVFENKTVVCECKGCQTTGTVDAPDIDPHYPKADLLRKYMIPFFVIHQHCDRKN